MNGDWWMGMVFFSFSLLRRMRAKVFSGIDEEPSLEHHHLMYFYSMLSFEKCFFFILTYNVAHCI